jgi:N-acetylneuraminic acid mutarotase/pimeloyl-ACP methyl ester carboxylesterase
MPILLWACFFVFAQTVRAEENRQWILKTSMPTARRVMASSVLDGNIYLAGGLGQNGETLNNLEVYNPVSDIWEIKQPMSVARWGLASGVIDGKYYVVMGGSPVPSGAVETEQFDPTTNQWTLKSDMLNPGWGVAAGVINNKLYVVGGFNWASGGMAWNREYNPTTNQWTLKASMPTSRSWLGVEVIDNKLYAIGGWNYNDTVNLPTLEVYDPATDTWAIKANMPIGLRNIATAVLAGKLYVIGGATGEGANTKRYSSVYVYNPASDTWQQLTDLPLVISEATAKTIGGDIYLFGGSTDNDVLLNTTYVWQAKKQLEPVILVPGVIASYLNNATTGEEIWPNIGDILKLGDNMYWSTDDLYLDVLQIDKFQNQINNSIKPTDIFRSISGNDFFSGLIQELENNGYQENKNLFVFPYDWRLNLNYTAGDSPYSWQKTLKQEIEEVKAATNSKKVDIIAHSMGGLLVKNYINKYGNDNINKFIDIATPQLGAPSAFKILNYGDNLGFCKMILGYNFCILNSQEVNKISQNMPSIYQLLPSRDYFESNFPNAAQGYIYNTDVSLNSISSIKDIMKIIGISKRFLTYDESLEYLNEEGRNDFLMGLSGGNAVNINDELHSRLDNLPSNDNYYNIIGCGQDTYAGIKTFWNTRFADLQPVKGDGTVPLSSAIDFGNNKYYIASSSHAYLPSFNGVRQLVVSILQNKENNFNFSDYKYLSKDISVCPGVSGTQVGAHSPVELHIYDEAGNHTGPTADGDIEESIPGVIYDILGEDKYAWLPAGHNYQIINQATSDGKLGITIDKVNNDQETQFVYFNDIQLSSALTSVSYNISDNQTGYQASIDYNGDGNNDVEINPSSILTGGQMDDSISPSTTIALSGQLSNNNYYISDVKVSLTATDDNSGVLKTEYSLDGGEIWIKYEEEFTVFQDGTTTILYSSTDRAGNREENKQITFSIDQTKPTINILLPQVGQQILRNKKLDIEYFADDNFSGIATDSAKFYLDNQSIVFTPIDLFRQSLDQHQIKITIQDLAGNQVEQTVNFYLITDIDGTIADVNRVYDEKMITKIEAKKDLVNDLTNIKTFQEKYGQRIDKEKEMRAKAMAQCLKHKNQAWCDKKIGTIFNRFEYQLSRMNQVLIKLKYNLILSKLDIYLKIKWINQAGYNIIKEDIKYLINKV